MKAKSAQEIPSIDWLPAERLGQLNVEPYVRQWLIGKGLLSARLKAACGERFALRLLGQWSGLLTASQKSALRSEENAGLFRDVQMCRDDQTWVFSQAVIPDSTLQRHSWLAELGDTPLDETLEGLRDVERSAFEYAWLPAADPLCTHVLSDADITPLGLWARRFRLALRGAPLLMQEVFLPAMSGS